MTYHRIYRKQYLTSRPFYFKGSSVRKASWVENPEEATVLPTQDANNLKRYFKEVCGYELTLEPVLPSELPMEQNAIKV